MLNDYLLKLLKSPAEASAAHWNEVKEFAEQYPYAALAHLFKAKISKDFSYENPNDNIRHASVYAADRVLLRKYLASESIERMELTTVNDVLQREQQQVILIVEEEVFEPLTETPAVPAFATIDTVTEIITEPNFETPAIIEEVEEIKEELENHSPELEIVEPLVITETSEPIIEAPINTTPPSFTPSGDSELDELMASLQALRNNRLHFQEEISSHTAVDGSIHFEPDWNNAFENNSIVESSSANITETPESHTISAIESNVPQESVEEFNPFDSFENYSPSLKQVQPTNQERFDGLSNDEKTYLDGAATSEEEGANPMFDTPFNTEQMGVGNKNAEDIFQTLMDESVLAYKAEHHSEQEFTPSNTLSLEEQQSLIDNFIANSPSISKIEPSFREFNIGRDLTENIEKEVSDMEIATETMAKLFMRQGRKDKAIETYLKLILKNPEKTAYFTAQIQAAAADNI